MTKILSTLKQHTALTASALCVMASGASADIVQADDVIIQSSLCAGIDCIDGESFGFDTMRLKENNLRIHFDDTSASASFPATDWRIVANDTGNGGTNHLSFQDASANTSPFRVEGTAPNNALVVESDGDIGIKTANPVVDIHVVEGNSPAIRLEQDGSDGFTAQTYDIAANEANFFIRDVTNGSRLFFRSKPGAPQDSIYIDANGNIGLGTSNPSEALHIVRTAADVNTDIRLQSTNAGGPGSGVWEFAVRGSDGEFAINDPEGPGAEFLFKGANATVPGLRVLGTLTATTAVVVNTDTLNVPDYVFADDYKLMPLTELETFIDKNSHLPNIPSAKEVNATGLDMTQMQLSLLEKIEELTLYTLAQQKTIDALQAEMRTVKN